MITKIVRGADLLCYINGNLVGSCTGVSYGLDYGRKSIYGIDSLNPFEVIPGPTKVSGKIDTLRIRGSGGLEGSGIVSRIFQVEREKYINISIIDRVSDLEILKVERAQVITQSWQASAKGMMTGNFTFEGIIADNEYANIFGA